MKTISLIDYVLKQAWSLTKKNFWLIFLIIITIIAIQWILTSIIPILLDWWNVENFFVSIIINLVSLFIWIFINIWRKNISFEISQNWETQYKKFFEKMIRLFPKFLWASLLYILVFIILFILPFFLFILSRWIPALIILAVLFSIFWFILFIIFAIRVHFFSYIIIDKNFWSYKSMKDSWDITKWHFRELIWFSVSKFIIFILWFCVILIWLLRAIPTNQIATASFYKKISWKSSDNNTHQTKPITKAKSSKSTTKISKKRIAKKAN